MTNWELRKFRNDLSTFIDKINHYKVPGDFTKALNDLKEELENKVLVDYHLKDLCLHVSGIKDTIPTEVNHFQIYFDNFLKFKDNCTADVDPLFKYKLEINIHAYTSKNQAGRCYKNSLHLDQHVPTATDKYTHPTYHFQYGGNKIRTLSTGDLIMLGAPRIPHPPMDVFLGFHFILANYFDNSKHVFVKQLLTDHEYKQIIKRAQARLWTPYFKAFDSTNTNNDFTMNNVFPLYIN
jgi:hypothetical protein